jgi:inosine/xanthosine triphosphatase
MKTVIVGTTNPAKIEAVCGGFGSMFPGGEFDFVPISVSSGVSEQPFSDEETLQGAFNRAREAAVNRPEADYWVGIEGGIEDRPGGMAAFAWVVVLALGMAGKSRSAAYFLPEVLAGYVREGMLLGQADDLFFGRINSNQSEGAIGILSGGVVDRSDLIAQAVALALLPFKNQSLYGEK